MSDAALAPTVQEELIRYYRHMAGRVEKHLRALPREKAWTKPFAFGNSVGHLVLHLTGNLNHYIGATIAKTGYVRDRAKEFTDGSPPDPDEALKRFHEAVDLVERTIRSLDAAALAAPIEGHKPMETQFGLLILCASHMNNHIGQMSYLVQALGHGLEGPPSW